MLIAARARTARSRHRRLHFELAKKKNAHLFGSQLLIGGYEGSLPRGLLLIIALILLLPRETMFAIERMSRDCGEAEETHRDTQRHTETNRDKDTQRHTETNRDIQRHTETQRFNTGMHDIDNC